MNPLEAISPIDGRYRKFTGPLALIFSESALMRYRLVVESEYLIALSELFNSTPTSPPPSRGRNKKKFPSPRGGGRGRGDLRLFTDKEKKSIRNLYSLSLTDARIISDIELRGYKNLKATDHDVKAIEYYMKDKLANTSLRDVLEWIHFGLTSYDINTPARGMMLGDALEKMILPKLETIYQAIKKLAKQYKNLPMLARSHGQPASPTTFGKEFGVTSERLRKQIKQLRNRKISVKFSGATGNFNAHVAAYPKVDWLRFTQSFIEKFNRGRQIRLLANFPTTQIDPHDSETEIFDNLRRINMILLDFVQDVWRYISDEWIVQKAMAGEIGSSTMPHKINPIKFENSEGNLGLANAILGFFSTKLPVSRLQRDLSDSTVERNFGVALAHCLIAYKYLLNGLSRIRVDDKKVVAALDAHPEILSEAIQTILRREGVKMPYEKLKNLTRGRQITLKDLHKFIEGLAIKPETKKELKKITPRNYIGLAKKLSDYSIS